MDRQNPHQDTRSRPGPDGAEAAELAFVALFRQLPRPAPRPGFADRVLARIARRSVFARPAVRFALAAAVVLAALSAALWVPMAGGIAGWIGPAAALRLPVDGFADIALRFARGLAAWEPLGVAARAILRALLEPRLAALLTTQLALAAFALRGLAALAASTRRNTHVAS